MSTPDPLRRPIVWGPGEGRHYPMGRIAATFKADGDEMARAYSIAEWWLDPYTTGPGAHSHDKDDVFYVIEGTMSVLVDTEWVDAPRGSFVLIPGGVTHDFENRTGERAGVLNFGTDGEFERNLPEFTAYFKEKPPPDTSVRIS